MTQFCLLLQTDFTRPVRKAVIVLIFGGGFVNGYSNAHLYGPDFLMENDVIAVSMNYRLGALGLNSF